MSSPPPQGNNVLGLDASIGALFFATLSSMALWGAGTIQLYFYYNNYSKDSRWLKVYVFIVWLFDTLHQGLLIGMAHRYLIAGFGDYQGLMQLDSLLVCAILVGGVICAMVQFIFIMRIWRLSERNVFVGGFVGALVLGQLVATCMYFAKAVQSETFANLKGAMIITRIVNSVTAAADSAIALCLVVLLHRTRSGFKQSDNTINRLIMFSINTGLVTSVCAILGLVLGFVFFDSLLFMVFFLMIARLYTNSLLAALNSRNKFRKSLIKASSNGPLNLTTEVFKTVTREAHFDDYGPVPPAVMVQHQRSQLTTGATRASVALDAGIDCPMSIDSFYSQSVYSIDLEDLGKVPTDQSTQSTPTKAQFLHSTDNWI